MVNVSFLLVATSATFASAFQSLSGRCLPSSAVLLLSRRELFTPHQKSYTTKLNTSLILDSTLLLSTTATDVVNTTEEWRQYVPLVVTSAVIIDILLGSPLANMALAPMKRATEEGAIDAGMKNSMNSKSNNANNNNGGGSLFSKEVSSSTSSSRGSRMTKERVDSGAIAKAALFKATNTLELRRFLDENKTDEQKYDEVRKQIDRQMSELDE
jgi:hypothetical protein